MVAVTATLFVLLSPAVMCARDVAPVRYLLDTPASAVPLNSTKGKSFLVSTETISDMYWLSFHHLTTQKTQSFCGIATSALILNAINIDQAPVDPVYEPYHYWTQDNFFTNCTDEIATADTVLHHGTTLEELAQMMRCHQMYSYHYHANETTEGFFRGYVAYALDNNLLIAANFRRVELGEQGGGHWSPLLAFNPVEDMVLLTDVARYKYGPLWVPVRDLFAAMSTLDSTSNLMRGFLLLSTKNATADLALLSAVVELEDDPIADSINVLLPIGFSFGVLLAVILCNKVAVRFAEHDERTRTIETAADYEIVNILHNEDSSSGTSFLHTSENEVNTIEDGKPGFSSTLLH